MAPFSITRIRSASRIVDSRWAITNDVRPVRRVFIARWISTSVRVSTELVASSRIRMLGSARNARAIVISCFSPADTLEPSSSITVSMPSGRVLTKWFTCAAAAASATVSGVGWSAPYAMLSKMVPPNSQVSCSTMPMCSRSSSRGIEAMSTPSRVIRPDVTS
jgi:hypothetical protein